MPTRSSVDIIEQFNRALSRNTRKRIVDDVLESLRDENPYPGLVALHALSLEKKAKSILSDTVYEKIRRVLTTHPSIPESQKAALLYLEKQGLKEKGISGHLESYDLFYKIMMDIDRPMELRRVAASCLIFWGASWLTAHPVDSAALLDYCHKERETRRPSPELSRVVKIWTTAYENPQSGPKKMDGALLLGMVDLEWCADPLLLIGFLNSRKKEIMEKGSDLHRRWLEKVMPRLDSLLHRLQVEVTRSERKQKVRKHISREVSRLLSPGQTRKRSATESLVNLFLEKPDRPDPKKTGYVPYSNGLRSLAYGDLRRWVSSQKL